MLYVWRTLQLLGAAVMAGEVIVVALFADRYYEALTDYPAPNMIWFLAAGVLTIVAAIEINTLKRK